ncbi:MAG: hypothetical protein GVY33_15590 [Alphaproteobacteria bacterium]|jgi:ribosomal protein L11 methylase PrmA|nr:hypothetical protein [Alphaproteobacteria bacterium]
MTRSIDPSGRAALAICESLLLALRETEVIDAGEARGILADAAVTHRQAAAAGVDAQPHEAVARIIEAMLLRLNLANDG